MLVGIARQIKQLATAAPAGVRYVPGDSLTEVIAELDGPVGTPYEGGVFRVKLVLGSEYPAAPPKGACCARISARDRAVPGTRARPRRVGAARWQPFARFHPGAN